MSSRKEKEDLLNPEDLYENVLQALRLWYDTGLENPLAHLQIVRRALHDQPSSVRKVVNRLLDDAFDRLAGSQPQKADLLRLRFLDRETGETVANRLALSASAFNRLQKEAVIALAGILLAQEDDLRAEQQLLYLSRLEPSSYEWLFGIDATLQTLLDAVAAAESPWIIALEGMGGMGKTSLADALIRAAISHLNFDGFGWISARQHRYELGGTIRALDRPAMSADGLVEKLAQQLLGEGATPSTFSAAKVRAALRSHLKKLPHLIVLDNLETVADVEALLPTLQDLANPTKFVLTSRTSVHSEAVTFPYLIPELSEVHALELIRHEARQRNQLELAEAPDAELRPIFGVVGGNPLALRLVVGQIRIHALASILDDFKQARGQTIENLYTFIYGYAWEHLDDLARHALIAMPFAPPQGATLEKLAGVSKLEPAELSDALTRLVNLNLISNRGNMAESRYTIHNLTRTFLLEQVVKWTP